MDILKQYKILRSQLPPMIKFGEIQMALTDDEPGFLTAARLLVDNIPPVKDCHEVQCARKDMKIYDEHLRRMQWEGHYVDDLLKESTRIITGLSKNDE